MRIFLASLAAAGLLAAPATASDPPKEKKICKRTDMGNTGSNLRRPSKICLTAAEWKEIEDATNRTLRKVRDNSGADPEHTPLSGGGPS